MCVNLKTSEWTKTLRYSIAIKNSRLVTYTSCYSDQYVQPFTTVYNWP